MIRNRTTGLASRSITVGTEHGIVVLSPSSSPGVQRVEMHGRLIGWLRPEGVHYRPVTVQGTSLKADVRTRALNRLAALAVDSGEED